MLLVSTDYNVRPSHPPGLITNNNTSPHHLPLEQHASSSHFSFAPSLLSGELAIGLPLRLDGIISAMLESGQWATAVLELIH